MKLKGTWRFPNYSVLIWSSDSLPIDCLTAIKSNLIYWDHFSVIVSVLIRLIDSSESLVSLVMIPSLFGATISRVSVSLILHRCIIYLNIFELLELLMVPHFEFLISSHHFCSISTNSNLSISFPSSTAFSPFQFQMSRTNWISTTFGRFDVMIISDWFSLNLCSATIIG